MRLAFISICAAGALLTAAAGTGDVIRTAAELGAATFDHAEIGRDFELTGRMVTGCHPGAESTFAFQDDSGYIMLRKERVPWTNLTITAGSRVHVTGYINLGQKSRRAYARCMTLETLAPGTPPEPADVTAAQFLSGDFDCRLVRFRGTIRDIARDEIDPDYIYIVLTVDSENLLVPLSEREGRMKPLAIGQVLEVSGICAPPYLGGRQQIGRHLSTGWNQVRILSDAAEDPFLAPELKEISRLRPQEIAALGRRRVTGRVLAVWQRHTALLRTGRDRIVGLEAIESDPPRPGDLIEAVGFPESDLYHVNLSRVIWRKLPGDDAPADAPIDIAAEELQTDAAGRRRFDPYAHGRTIRLRGIVRNLPGDGNEDGRFNIESGSFIVPVDVSSTPEAIRELSVGCEISVAGTCVMESENWRPNVPFPKIRGFTVVVRGPADIAVLRHPSWWTPLRLLMIVGVLLVFLLGSLVWSMLLKRLAERRGRELAQSAIAKAEADLKVYERTRLAVEIHDSLSQYLTGISLSVRAAERQLGEDPESTRQNLRLAVQSLDSCREEMKNCLWDLRNDTLGAADMNTAITDTLNPHLGEAELNVRFNIPRERFTDNTAHAILHILRELATNSVRHGHATRVSIAGSIEGETLLFSVRDNGCGFDPDHHPGMDEGHFGLQGIRERVNQFEGRVAIESRPGHGSKVTISIHIPRLNEKNT